MKFYDSDLEIKILSFCFYSKETMAKISKENLTNLFYDPTARALYVAARKVFKDHNISLTEDILNQILSSQNIDENKSNLCKLMFMESKALSVDNNTISFYIEQLKSYALRRKIYDILNTSISSVGELESKDVLNELLSQLTPLQQSTQNIPLIERYIYDKVEDRKKTYIHNKENPIQTKGLQFGFTELDNMTNGLYPKEVALFIGRVGQGKSRTINNIAFNLAQAGHPGILFSLEMYINQLERIFDSRGARVSYTKIKKGQLDVVEEDKYFSFLEDIKKNKPPLYLIDYSVDCTPSFVQSVIRERKKYQKIEWVCLDYLSLMNPDEKWQNEPTKFGLIARELKQLAKSENIAIITAAQSNRESIKVKKVGTEHISFSDQISHHCDIVVHLRQSSEQEMQNILEMNVTKYRDGKSNFKFELLVDWDKNFIGSLTEDKSCQNEEKKSEINLSYPLNQMMGIDNPIF